MKFFQRIFAIAILFCVMLVLSDWSPVKVLPVLHNLVPSAEAADLLPKETAKQSTAMHLDKSAKIVDLSTHLTREQALLLYQQMIDALPENGRNTFKLLFDLMKKGRMPVFYPGEKVVGGQYFQPVQFNPKEVIALTTSEYKNCSKDSRGSGYGDWINDCLAQGKCPPSTETGIVVGGDDGNNITSCGGSFLYLLGKGKNELKQIHGGSIIQLGSGEDAIQVGAELSIIVFQSHWGRDTIAQAYAFPKWLGTMKDSAAKEEWKKTGFEYQQFIVFGPGIFPEDMQWDSYTQDHIGGKKPIILKNIKTGDQITFKSWPRFNFVFHEDGKFESWPEFGEREGKRRTDEARQHIEDLKIPQRYGERLKSCVSDEICYLSLARDITKEIDDARKKCEIESSIVLAKFKADGSTSVQDAISFASSPATLKADPDKPNTCEYDYIQLALGLAKSGKTDEALKTALTGGNNARSRIITGRTKVLTEVMRSLIEKKRSSDALDAALEYLQEEYAAANADLLLVVDPDFYHIAASLDYKDKLKAALPLEADFFTKNKELENAGEKLFRLLLIVAFDDKSFSAFDSFIPSGISADTKDALYFMIAAQMAYAKKEDQLTFFLKRGVDESKNVSNLDLVRGMIGNTYLPLMLGDRQEALEMGHILGTNPDQLYAQSVVLDGAQALQANNIPKAEAALHKSNGLLPQLGIAPSYVVDLQEAHLALTKGVVKYLLLEKRDMEKATAIFKEAQAANSEIKEEEINELLAVYYAQQEVEKAFNAAEAIVDFDGKLKTYQAIASNAERKNDKKTLDAALEKAGVIFKSLPENEKPSRLWNLHRSALAEENKSHALAELMVSLGPAEHRDGAYEKIALSAAKDKQIERAMRNVELIKSDEAKALAKNRLAQELASNGLTEEALELSASNDQLKLEIVRQWSATRLEDAVALASSIKDPYIFAQAALVLAEEVDK